MSIWDDNQNNDQLILSPDAIKAREAEHQKFLQKVADDAMVEQFEKDQQRYFGGRGVSEAIHDALVYGLVSGKGIFGVDPRSLDAVDPGPAPCAHQPVDVGFAVTKMVCKKCNKDL